MNLQENINRIKQVMGLNESVLEGEDELNRLLDKIGEVGYDSLSNKEKIFLHQYSKEKPIKEKPIKEKPTSWNYFINVHNPKIKNFEMSVKFIKHILDRENIDYEVGYTMLGFGLMIQVKIQHEFQLEKSIEELSNKGYEIFDKGSIHDNSESTGKYFHDKIDKMKYSSKVDISFIPIHGNELTRDQEWERIRKVLRSIDYFGGYSMLCDGITYDMYLRKPEMKDKVKDVLIKKGYEVY